MADVSVEAIAHAMERAFNMGQTFWQQVDSDYTSQHRKADVTFSNFKKLKDETVAVLISNNQESAEAGGVVSDAQILEAFAEQDLFLIHHQPGEDDRIPDCGIFSDVTVADVKKVLTYLAATSTMPADGVLPPGAMLAKDYIAEVRKDPKMSAAMDAMKDRITPTSGAAVKAEPVAQELWALCYLHDWDPQKQGQEHRWEPGKNIFPEVSALYLTWQDAQDARAKKLEPKLEPKLYWIVRARLANPQPPHR